MNSYLVDCFSTAPATAKMTLHVRRDDFMPGKRFLLIPIRTNKQGVQINVGKDGDEYNAIVNTMTMHADDMKDLGAANGSTIRVRTDIGEATFPLKKGKVARLTLRPLRPRRRANWRPRPTAPACRRRKGGM